PRPSPALFALHPRDAEAAESDSPVVHTRVNRLDHAGSELWPPRASLVAEPFVSLPDAPPGHHPSTPRRSEGSRSILLPATHRLAHAIASKPTVDMRVESLLLLRPDEEQEPALAPSVEATDRKHAADPDASMSHRPRSASSSGIRPQRGFSRLVICPG